MTTTEVRRERFDIRQEMDIIPGWAWALAVAVFFCMVVLFLGIWTKKPPGPPIPAKILITLFASTILGFYVLMIGYVNSDAGRRGMSRTVWTLIVIFVPNAIGFILYFLLRHPIRMHCPRCAAVADPRVNFCPACGFSFHPTCPKCQTAIRPADQFCANCGATLKA